MINLTKIGTLTSGYGSRKAPNALASTNHQGIDVVLKNKNIPSVIDGTVTATGYHRLSGHWIEITGTDGMISRYQHMAQPATLKKGATVKEGETVGIMGNSGNSTGPHLHYEVMDKNRKHMNPLDYLKKGVSSYTPKNEKVQGEFATTVPDASTQNGSNGSGGSGFLSKILKGAATGLFAAIAIVLAVLFLLKAFDLKI